MKNDVTTKIDKQTFRDDRFKNENAQVCVCVLYGDRHMQ